ncbi:MAG: hypothetical protein R6V56_08070 [Lentisphaeria bacterium]
MNMEHLRVSKENSALLLVDLQSDFFPGGALAVSGGDEILPGVRELMQSEKFGIQDSTLFLSRTERWRF